jgi:hypothetical protein
MSVRYEERTINLTVLREGPEDAVRDHTFIRCRVRGPVHARILEHVDFKGNTTFELPGVEDPQFSDAVLVLERDVTYVGAINISDCAFEDCTFVNVKLIVTPFTAQQLQENGDATG